VLAHTVANRFGVGPRRYRERQIAANRGMLDTTR
jgi:hypothetical protein